MASGLEAVGLVLAIFPILVEGLKFYKEQRSRVRDFIRYRHVLKRITRDLSREQTSFRNFSYRFLEGISMYQRLSAHDIEQMMENPKDVRWRNRICFAGDPLRVGWINVFLETVEDMNEALTKIQDLVGIRDDEQSQPAMLDRSTLRRQWDKIVLVLGESEINDHLERARTLNNFLGQLTQQIQPIIPSKSPSRRSTIHYKQIRLHAIELYEIFQAKFPTPPTCGCVREHAVNMRLEFRSAQMTAEGLYFHTIFTFDQDGRMTSSSSYNWREIEMEPMETRRLCQDPHSSGQLILISGNVSYLTRSSSMQPTRQIAQEISNLCSVIQGPIDSQDWLGYLTNSQGCRHRLRVISLNLPSTASPTIETISLTEVLNHQEFLSEHRCRLALKLASSVMQLHETKWLTNHWSKEDISFTRYANGKIDFNNPLIRRTFGSDDASGALTASGAPVISADGSIPCLFSLGIVLLELSYRQTFQSLKTQNEDSLPPEYADLVAAKRLVNAIDCTPNFKRVMKRCISGLDPAFNSLQEDAFRDEVEEKIVQPLEEDLKFYCDKDFVEECLDGL